MQADVPPPPIINNVTMAEAEKAKQEIHNTGGVKKEILIRLICPACWKRGNNCRRGESHKVPTKYTIKYHKISVKFFKGKNIM